MAGVSPLLTGGPVPLSAPSTMPLKRGDDDEIGGRSLRPTLSFRQKPEPPKLPPQLTGDEGEKGLRATLSFRQKPEPPKGVSFLEPPKPAGEMDAEKQRQMQKTKSKIDMLQSLIREGSSAGAAARAGSDSDDSSDDEPAAALPQGTGGRALIRPSAPPPPPPGLSGDLPPLPKATIKPPPPPPASAKPAPPSKSPSPPPNDDNAAENWVTMWSPEKNRNYFYNKKTGASTWEDPSLLQSGGQTSPTSQQQQLAAAPSKAPRANGLEKAIHKKTMERPTDDEVDVFGRPSGETQQEDSRGSSGSSAGRMSLRKTLSRALGLTANPKKTSSLRLGSDSGSDSHKPTKPVVDTRQATATPASQTTIPPEPSPIFAENSGRGSMRSFGSMVSMSSGVSHESESRSVERPIHDKHVEVVAEVRTKAGRHTIVRAKKSKKKDHSMVLEEAHLAPNTPGVFIAPLQSPMAATTNPGFQPSVPLGPPPSGVVPVVTPSFQHVQQQHVQQQQGLARTASANHMVGARPPFAGGGPPLVQHFGAPHPQHMGPGFVQPQPFAAYAGAPPSPQFAPHQPQVFPNYGGPGYGVPGAQPYAPPSPQPYVPSSPQSYAPPSPKPFGLAPPPVPQPRMPVRYVQALYDFRPSNPANVSEMPLKRGDMVQLVEQGADGWWEGVHCVTGHRGLFPGSHVQFVQ